MLKHPLNSEELERFQSLLPTQKPSKPIVFVFGHGLWNDLDLQATVDWLNGILSAIYDRAQYLRPETMPQEGSPAHATTGSKVDSSQPMAYMLFITPSAAGILKPDQWEMTQGNKALQVFEDSINRLVYRKDGLFYAKGIEHMGTWNMSIQMSKWDGVHLDLKGNLIKAMGVINWLAGVDVDKWQAHYL